MCVCVTVFVPPSDFRPFATAASCLRLVIFTAPWATDQIFFLFYFFFSPPWKDWAGGLGRKRGCNFLLLIFEADFSDGGWAMGPQNSISFIINKVFPFFLPSYRAYSLMIFFFFFYILFCVVVFWVGAWSFLKIEWLWVLLRNSGYGFPWFSSEPQNLPVAGGKRGSMDRIQ